jgi:hypothetical protein
MTDPAHTDRIIAQGKALVRAIEALSIIEPSGWFEHWQMRLLQAAYKERLRAIVAAVPGWVAEQILSASEHIGEDRAAVWFGENRDPAHITHALNNPQIRR